MRSAIVLSLALAIATTAAAQQTHTPQVTWPLPKVIMYPTPLNTVDHLNATADVPGTFVYNPPAGTVLQVGFRHPCLAFTPTDSTYETVINCADVWVDLTTPASTPAVEAVPMSISGEATTGHYVAFDEGRLFALNPASIEVRDSHSFGILATIDDQSDVFCDLVIDTGRKRVYASGISTVRTFDTTTLGLVDVTVLPDAAASGGACTVLVEEPGAGRLYVGRPPVSVMSIDLTKAATDPARASLMPGAQGNGFQNLAIDESSRLLYVVGLEDGSHTLVEIVDADPERASFLSVLTTVLIPGAFFVNPTVAADRRTHRVYVGAGEGIEVIDGTLSSPSFGTVVDVITNADLGIDFGDSASWWHVIAIDPDRGRFYDWVTNTWAGWRALLVTGDLSTKAMLSRIGVADDNPYGANFQDSESLGRLQLNPFDHRVFIFDGTGGSVDVVTDTAAVAASTPAAGPGQPVSVSIAGVTTTFSSVATGGITSITTIDPADVNLTVPGAFALQGTGFELTTTASVGSPILLCFSASTITDPIAFAGLHVLHGEGGAWVDRTSSRDYASGQVCASVSSFSPFALARQTQPAHSVLALFEQTKAVKLGSTIPIKIRVNNPDQSHASSAALTVRVIGLARVSDDAPGVLMPAGNANPDETFRYDAGLAGYIYNLRTSPLATGTWEMTLAVGLDSTTYRVRFQVR